MHDNTYIFLAIILAMFLPTFSPRDIFGFLAYKNILKVLLKHNIKPMIISILPIEISLETLCMCFSLVSIS